MTIGFFGGSFNPIHSGHILLARHLVGECDLDMVWMSLSPQNPLKAPLHGASDTQREAMLRLACEPYPCLQPCVEELLLPKPSYTINTLRHLQAKFPQHHFRLIIGADNWLIFQQWRQWQAILRDFGVIVYPRPGYQIACAEGVTVAASAPQFQYSSTEIRSAVAAGKPVDSMLPASVVEYIKSHHLYQIEDFNS